MQPVELPTASLQARDTCALAFQTQKLLHNLDNVWSDAALERKTALCLPKLWFDNYVLIWYVIIINIKVWIG